MPLSIKPTRWQLHHVDLKKIRTAVFIQEQNVSVADEWDGLDEDATHFLVSSTTGEAIGCARLLREIKEQDSLWHIGRVAILKSFRNQGIGHQLMQFVIDYCRQTARQHTIYLHAQTTRRTFYEALGFVAQGEEFMDAGIPHISMHLKP